MNQNIASIRPSKDTANETVIEADVEIHGVLKIKGKKNIIIRGLIEGEVESNGGIVVEASGVIRGAIITCNLDVYGRVETENEVSVLGKLFVHKGGVLIASKISYGDLNHESGARMTGQLEPSEMIEQEVEEQIQSIKPVIDPEIPLGFLNRRPAFGAESPSIWKSPTDQAAMGAPQPIEGVADLPFRNDVTEITDANANATSALEEISGT